MDETDLPDFALVEAAVRDAISRRDASSLTLLGHGDISIVLGWPTDAPTHAVKRVPPFRSEPAALRYVDVCRRNLEILRAAEVATWPTTFHLVHRDDGATVVYHRQPIAPASQVGSSVLRDAPPADAHPLLDAIVTAAAAVVTPMVGLDVQVANWIWDGTTAHQIDFTSPFLLNDERDDLQFDTSGFLREYPALLRPYLRRELLGLVRRFTTPEGALGDMVGNLHKEGLEQWVEPAIVAAGRRGIVIDRTTAAKMYEDDKKLLPLTLKLKKGQRWWISHTGRRYDSLLPERTTYGL